MKMKATLGKLVLLVVTFFLVSCGGYDKLLKSKDHDAKWKAALGYYEHGKYTKTMQLLGDLLTVYGGTPLEDSIAFILGSAAYMQTDFLTAQEVLGEYRKVFGRSHLIEEAEYMYTMCFYYMSPKPHRDQGATVEAMRAIQEFVSRYPNSKSTEDMLVKYQELQQKLYDKALLNAKVYYNIGYYNSAVAALRSAINAWPQSNHNEELNYLIVSAWYKFAKNSVPARQRERYVSMQDAYLSFIADYPESAYRKELDEMNKDAVKYLAKFKTAEEIEIIPVATETVE